MLIEKDGQQIEVFTQEELNQKIEEEKSKIPDGRAEIDKLKSDLAKKEEELKKVGDKDYNFSELRKSKEDLEAKLKEVEDKQKEFISSSNNKEILNKISNISNGDKELEKKIRFHFDRIVDVPKNDEELAKKVADAYVLAVGESSNSKILDAISSHGAPINSQNSGKGGELTQDVMNVAKNLGITDKDVEEAKKQGVI